MIGALNIGFTGLRSAQQYLDVIGNNLANSQTNGFKSDRVTFQDVFYQTFRPASGPSGAVGGTNARQVGTGAQVAGVDQNHAQGSLQATGRPFDLALQGEGFFVLSDGSSQFFTRVGTFGLDASSNLVDTRTGLFVLDSTGTPINLPRDSAIPAQATSSMTFAGNLPAKVTGPLAAQLASSSPFEDHQAATMTSGLAAGATVNLDGLDLTVTVDSAAPVTLSFPTGVGPINLATVRDTINNMVAAQNIAPSFTASLDASGQLVLTSDTTGSNSLLSVTGTAASALMLPTTQAVGSQSTAVATTRLNDLSANTVDYVAGDTIQITGMNDQGQPVNVSFTYGAANDGETLGDLVNFINSSGAFPNATVSLGTDGKIHLDATNTGESPLLLVLGDGAGSTGATAWSSHLMETVVQGAGPDTRTTSITIFDSLGLSHTITGNFTRQDDGTWNLDLTLPDGDGTITGGTITGISFGPDGSYQGVQGQSVSISYQNGAAPQTIDLDLGEPGGFGGMTQFGDESTAHISEQDGFEAGTLLSLSVTSAGLVQGFFSNGQLLDLNTIGIATFPNREGLVREGMSLFRNSDNSGTAVIGTAGEGPAGTVVSGTLEGSNVDVAEEFIRLIEAQRSFQGSARVVTTANDVLTELLNIL